MPCSDDDQTLRGGGNDSEDSGLRRAPVQRRKTFTLPPAATAMASQMGKVTEVRLVNTAFGPAKLQEDGKGKRFLVMRQHDGLGSHIPYVDRNLVAGAFCIALDRAMTLGQGVARYPVLDVIPTMFLDTSGRAEVQRALRISGLALQFPEEIDLTAAVREELARGALLERRPGASYFALDLFVSNIVSVRASPQFERIYLIEVQDGSRHVMVAELLIDEVVGLHPYFGKLDVSAAVRLQVRDSQNVWIAPLG